MNRTEVISTESDPATWSDEERLEFFKRNHLVSAGDIVSAMRVEAIE